MKTIKNIENLIVIDKSEFITTLIRVETAEEANIEISKIKKQYFDANHNCFCYIIGKNQEIQKASDDGEPSGTAGRPMLDALLKNDVTNVLAVVTRYFGGIKLGAGGLIRAYSKSVSQAIKNTSLIELVKLNVISFSTDYSISTTINKKLDKRYILHSIDYLENVKYVYYLFDHDIDQFTEDINFLTNSKVILNYNEKVDYEYEITS